MIFGVRLTIQVLVVFYSSFKKSLVDLTWVIFSVRLLILVLVDPKL